MTQLNLKKYRDPKAISRLVTDLKNWEKPLRIMEVCGSHTMAIGHWGIRKLLPKNISLISGPGCPVCVTPSSLIDELMKLKGVTIAIFGDMLRVPGKEETLEQARAKGLDVRIVYSPLDALKMSQKNETVFVGIGFETTIPGIAQTILMAKKQNLKNFSVFPAFKLVPPALEALLSDEEIKLDGFLLPGHVSVIIGAESYKILPEKYNVGGVVAGFEPLDILRAIKYLTLQIDANISAIVNEYNRVVDLKGNENAHKIIDQVLCIEDALWRGIGWLPKSGLRIREKFSKFDASKKYGIILKAEEGNTGCRCADVLKGKIIPPECSLFEKKCNPAHPIGPCMVSSEGSCAAYFKYER